MYNNVVSENIVQCLEDWEAIARAKGMKYLGSMEADAYFQEAKRYQAVRESILRKEEQPCPECHEYYHLSWDGKNIKGDKASIQFVKQALHEAHYVPEFKERIKSTETECEKLKAERDLSTGILNRVRVEVAETAASICEKSDRYRGEYFAALIREEAGIINPKGDNHV